MPERLLILRLSAFGDIVQCAESAEAFKTKFPSSSVHWVAREDFAQVMTHFTSIDKVWSVSRAAGWWGLWRLAGELRRQNFTHVYDAHNNLRSRILLWIFRLRGARFIFIRRSKERFRRFLLFVMRINLFAKPFKGAVSYLAPLTAFGIRATPQKHHLRDLPLVDLPFSKYVALCPSANWELKRWPIEHWQRLIQQSSLNFVVMGGSEDKFCADIAAVAPERARNLAGELSWSQSAAVISRATAVISGDTGLMHLADYLGVPNLALIGPTAFGYPARDDSKVLELTNLRCKPCTKDGRGRCVNSLYKRCLVEIQPADVLKNLGNLI